MNVMNVIIGDFMQPRIVEGRIHMKLSYCRVKQILSTLIFSDKSSGMISQVTKDAQPQFTRSLNIHARFP